MNLVSDGHVVLKNIKLATAAAPGTNLIASGDATSHSTNNPGTIAPVGFLCGGTHCLSDTLADGFHLISYGSGDTKANKVEVDVPGLTGSVAAPQSLILTFEARWVSGMPLVVAQTWDRSFGKVFRLPARRKLWELCAGRIDAGETPLRAAKRELREETGLRARQWKKLAAYWPSPGFLEEKMNIFLATGLTQGESQWMDDERIETRWFTERDLDDQIRHGKIEDGKTLVGFLTWRRYHRG